MSKVNRELNCPYCDEKSVQERGKYALRTPDKIYIPRKCIMGHTFYSVEYIPENQEEIAQEIAETRSLWHVKKGSISHLKEKDGVAIKAEDM